MGGVHLGDILVQMVFLGIVAFVVILLIKLFRSSNRNRHN